MRDIYPLEMRDVKTTESFLFWPWQQQLRVLRKTGDPYSEKINYQKNIF